MGREIRRVPANWEHPGYTPEDARDGDQRLVGQFRPCYDADYTSECARWKRELAQWEDGTHPDKGDREFEFWEYESPPDPDTCRPAFTTEPTWWQVYETVTEGTPVTPPFATAKELIEHLVRYGDEWDQRRGARGWPRNNAEEFVLRSGWAPSFVASGGTIFPGHLFPGHLPDEETR